MAKCRKRQGGSSEPVWGLYDHYCISSSANTWWVPVKQFLWTFSIKCSSAHVPLRSLWCVLILTCSAFLIMFQRWWLKPWFSSWLMSYNWAGYLLLGCDERSPLIHSCSSTFDGTCFNLCGATPKLILKQRFTDEATQSWDKQLL